MIQFAYFQQDWREEFPADWLDKCLGKFSGCLGFTTLEVRSDAMEYCLHTRGIDSDDVQLINDFRYEIDEKMPQWIQNIFDKEQEFITLSSPEELLKLLEYIENFEEQKQNKKG